MKYKNNPILQRALSQSDYLTLKMKKNLIFECQKKENRLELRLVYGRTGENGKKFPRLVPQVSSRIYQEREERQRQKRYYTRAYLLPLFQFFGKQI